MQKIQQNNLQNKSITDLKKKKKNALESVKIPLNQFFFYYK